MLFEVEQAAYDHHWLIWEAGLMAKTKRSRSSSVGFLIRRPRGSLLTKVHLLW